MDAACRPSAAAMNGDDAAGGAFDELRGVIGKCDQRIGGLGHGKLSRMLLQGRDVAMAWARCYWPNGQEAAARPRQPCANAVGVGGSANFAFPRRFVRR